MQDLAFDLSVNGYEFTCDCQLFDRCEIRRGIFTFLLFCLSESRYVIFPIVFWRKIGVEGCHRFIE